MLDFYIKHGLEFEACINLALLFAWDLNKNILKHNFLNISLSILKNYTMYGSVLK